MVIKAAMAISLSVLFLLFLSFAPFGRKDNSRDVDIFLISNDIHVGIALPVTNAIYDWKPFVVNEHFPSPETVKWIHFGWGDRQFYFEIPTWEHFTLKLAFDALFIPDQAVMHVEVLRLTPDQSSDYVRKISISFETYQKLVHAIKSWFILQNETPVIIPGKGYSPEDQFFEARGSYSLLKTCNIWTSDIFKEAGLAHPLWSPTKHGMEYIWRK